MKKKLFTLLAIVMFLIGTVCSVNATLIVRGTDVGGNRLIYDTVLDITWYDYTLALDSWQHQVQIAESLIIDFEDVTYDDWRLTTALDGPIEYSYDGSTPKGYNVTTSEMGHLYYEGLGNLGYYAIDGTSPQPGYGLENTDPFINLLPNMYWSGTMHPGYVNGYTTAWMFQFYDGNQSISAVSRELYGIAVRDGDVAAPVPEPCTLLLLGTGLAGLGLYRKKKGKV